MMAGLYIPGMDIPRCCEDCKLYNAEYDYCNYNNCTVGYEYSNKRMDDCPLVEVPNHGDLIDRDSLWKKMTDLYDKRAEEANMTGNRVVCVSWHDAVVFLKSSPVVVPAENTQNDLEVVE